MEQAAQYDTGVMDQRIAEDLTERAEATGPVHEDARPEPGLSPAEELVAGMRPHELDYLVERLVTRMGERPGRLEGEGRARPEGPVDGRALTWDEATVEERVERLRRIVRRIERDLPTIYRTLAQLERHSHDPLGRIVVPLDGPNLMTVGYSPEAAGGEFSGPRATSSPLG